jgi:hypothetical protein
MLLEVLPLFKISMLTAFLQSTGILYLSLNAFKCSENISLILNEECFVFSD